MPATLSQMRKWGWPIYLKLGSFGGKYRYIYHTLIYIEHLSITSITASDYEPSIVDATGNVKGHADQHLVMFRNTRKMLRSQNCPKLVGICIMVTGTVFRCISLIE